MINTGLLSHALATAAYAFFALLLLFSWRRSRPSRLLVLVMLVSAVWTGAAVSLLYGNVGDFDWRLYRSAEVLRYGFWYAFLFTLLKPALLQLEAGQRGLGAELRRFGLFGLLGFSSIVLVADLLSPVGPPTASLVGHVFLALFALVLLEQVYRNAAQRYRWAIKYLMIGAGCLFVYDFYMYADALLFRHLDPVLWQARGLVQCMAVPLLAIAAVRSRHWSLNLFVSRDIVLTSAVIIAAGFYLMATAVAGYYLRQFGGGWGRLGQVTLIVLALIALVSVLLSAQLRAWLRVFLGKHFYRNKYDYRVEWLRLTAALNRNIRQQEQYRALLETLGSIVEARAGLLWLADEPDGKMLRNQAQWRYPHIEAIEPVEGAFVRFMQQTGYVIHLPDVPVRDDEYHGLRLPSWMSQLENPWLVVPLFDGGTLFGFIVLGQPLVDRGINWEDRDLLKTAARQIANHLKILEASAHLAEAKQFEVFSRLSAYMVHDLKNIAAELELVAQNAERHSTNPAFISDAFETVQHAASDIRRLLAQLRERRAEQEKSVVLDLPGLIAEVVASRQQWLPAPVFEARCEHCRVKAEAGQLKNVLAHLLENAQQATADDGRVAVVLEATDDDCLIHIEDNGHGMDAKFIRERLFKPFDTTKGNAGMGIGMYESRDFVRSLGGDILVQSEPGKGSIISLRLPQQKPQAEVDNADAAGAGQ